MLLDLRHAWADGPTQLVVEPLALVERLAALAPRPRINLLLYYGVSGARSARRSRLRESEAEQSPAASQPSSQKDSRADAAIPPRSNWLWAEWILRTDLPITGLIRPIFMRLYLDEFFSKFTVSADETSTAPFHLVWRVYPHLDLIQMSGTLSGIAALERRNLVSLSVEFMTGGESRYAVMELVVTERKTGRVKNIAIDFYDRTDRISTSALQFSDIYYKRQYGPEIQAAAGPLVTKIVPAGPPVGGYSAGALRHVCRAILGSLRSADAHGGLADVLRRAYDDTMTWATLPPPDDAVLQDSDVKGPHIVFQPRLWETTPGSHDQFDVANEDRIALVRALRQGFPDEHAVGLLHTEMAARVAPDLRLRDHVRTSMYHRQLRSSLVAVNCVGLSGSVGWKFAEYLAAGNAVVSQPIRKQLFAPVVEGVHYLAYESPEECVEQCRRLIADRALSARMSEVNRRYYQEWVSPPAHLTHLLKRAFA